MTNHAVEVVFAPKEQDVANELSERFGYDTVKARSRSGPRGLAMRTTSETVFEHRRALMLPQELKLLPKSKAFILMAGVSPIVADKIVYYQDEAFLERLLPASVLELPKGRSTALLDAEIKELRAAVAELRAVFRARPLSDEEIADPSTIPANATFDFGGVDVDLEGLTEEEMKAWTLNFTSIPRRWTRRGARTASRKESGRALQPRDHIAERNLEAHARSMNSMTSRRLSPPSIFARFGWLSVLRGSTVCLAAAVGYWL